VTGTSASRGLLAYLVLTAVVCGGLVMVLEVLGSRVIGPFFGVSLYVWTSLISVTLVSLAGGYAVGGVLADRFRSPTYLFTIVMIAGLLALAIPPLKSPVLAACVPLGLRAGSLVGTLILFGPALFALGCVTPYILRVAVRELDNLGRAAGGFYALSTLGSVLGTLATGFLLIGYLGVTEIFRLAAVLLIALACGYFIIFRRRWLVTAALLAPLLPTADAPVEARMNDGTRVALVAARESFYGAIKVVDYRYGALHTRELLIDGLVQGGMDVGTGLPVYEYTYFLQLLPYATHPGGERALVIGLGAGLVPRWYESRGIVTDVVDIDPSIAHVARTYFGYRGAGDVIVADARSFLSSPGRRYDYIIVDVFNGDTTPGHVLSLEALRLMKARLNSEGVVAINLVGSLERHTFMTASVVATLGAVFEQVQIFPTFELEATDGAGNLTILAYDGGPRRANTALLGHFPVHPLAAKGVGSVLIAPYEFPAKTPSMLLTDDFNPMDVHDAWLRERVRRNILETTNWGILLGRLPIAAFERFYG
jgi:predicted membrane-bound spermidine synthase